MTKRQLDKKLNPLRQMLELLAPKGIGWERLYAATEKGTVPKLDESAFAVEEILQLLSAAAELSRDPLFALRLGEQLNRSDLGVLRLAIRSCADLRDILKLIVRYNAVFQLGNVWELHESEEGATLRFRMAKGSLEQQRMVVEAGFAQFFGLRVLVGRGFSATALHFAYPRPSHWEAYKGIFDAPLNFSQARSEIHFPLQVLSLPVSTANPRLHAVFEQHCEEMLSELNQTHNVSSEVRRILMLSIHEFPGFAEVALKLNMSESTLRRRLAGEGSSFRHVSDQVKDALAKDYLRNTSLSVADIAQMLEYHDSANFRRAFKRWNGIGPGDFRISNK